MHEATGTIPAFQNDSEEFQVHTGQVAHETQPADHFVVHHRLGQEAAGIGRAEADGRLPRGGNGASEALVQQAAENHHGNVACFAVGDAQSIDELAFNSHALKRGGENFSAAVHHQNFVALVGKLRHLTRQRFHRRRIIE